MKGNVVFLLLVLVTGEAICTRPIEGQTISIFRQFSTPEIDRAAALAVVASGIYVIGNRSPRQGGLWRAGVRKYDGRGSELWTREVSVPAPGGVQLIGAAADNTGVYVIGYLRPFGDTAGQLLRKYSAGGDELSTRQLEFQPMGGLAVDATGVFVAGSEFLRKYGVDGDELWTSRFAGSALSVAVDATGVYVLGRAATFFVRKWDARNPELVAGADPTGFYLAGGNGESTFLRKYDAGGNELWNRPVATSYSSLYLSGMVADASAGV